MYVKHLYTSHGQDTNTQAPKESLLPHCLLHEIFRIVIVVLFSTTLNIIVGFMAIACTTGWSPMRRGLGKVQEESFRNAVPISLQPWGELDICTANLTTT
jgi:hypothetical protein